MQDEFVDWIRDAYIDIDEGRLQARKAAVDSLIGTLDAGAVAELVKSYALDEPSQQGLIESVKEHDGTFSPKNAEYELRLLSGAVLRSLLEKEGWENKAANASALGLIIADFTLQKTQVKLFSHVQCAHDWLQREGNAARQTENQTDTTTAALGSFSDAHLNEDKALIEANAPAKTLEVVTKIYRGLDAANTANSQYADAFRQVCDRILVLEEESNILWWLMGETSRRLGRSFTEIGAKGALFVAAEELAGLETICTAHPGSAAFLYRALKSAGGTSQLKICLQDAVNETPRDWREMIKSQLDSAKLSLFPVSLALACSLDTDESDKWAPVFTAKSNVPIDEPYHAHQLSLQFFYECLMAEAIG